jgi:abortive infection bacteriophage resistance protein
MARPSKLTPNITKRIGENVALGLTYALAAESAGITYQTFNDWMNTGKTEKSGKYSQFYQHIQECNADTAKKYLECLNKAADTENCQVCMWILERRFPDEFGRWVHRKINSVSENQNVTVKIAINEADKIRKQILAKFDRGLESHELSAD